MGIHYSVTNTHWNYFLALEKDFELISRYVEFSERNNSTFSIELARLIMTSAQEVDVIMKKLCNLVSPNSPANNIGNYKTIIIDRIPEFREEEVKIPRFGMSSIPWLNWIENSDPPLWWTANNKIKHQRTDHFEKANLKNAFNSIGGLLVTTLYYYKKKYEQETGSETDWREITSSLIPRTSLIQLKDEYYHNPGDWSEVNW
ncbi:hypothetical protein [Aquimarina sp. 2201CG5-10]|uniref:hypothetical protein n=1 Tax=Aquimarina callyspongiae TaxID=3098150 RepID=UPI002AB4C008|nr:hypothetical protein [Aquimarina sp. 2201CG5-10]MDY8136913.1 hypothetical protein [Aquimarina sp. 2201CG5-10]